MFALPFWTNWFNKKTQALTPNQTNNICTHSFLNMNSYIIEGPGSSTTTVSKKQEKRRMIASPFWNCRVPPFCAYWPNKNAICPSFFLLFSRKKWFVAWWLPDYYDCWLAITVVRCRVLRLLQVQAPWVKAYFCRYLAIQCLESCT